MRGFIRCAGRFCGCRGRRDDRVWRALREFKREIEGRQNGKIVITASLVQPDWVEIAVRDDGLGIAQSHLDKVFDPFFTTKLGRGGSGLGLNIVYNLVTTSLGGRVQVVSTPGEGACFTLNLPLRVA